MEKLENSNQKKVPFLRTGRGAFVVSIILALVIWGISKWFKFYGSDNFNFYYWVATILGIGGLLMNLEWQGIGREFRRNINRKTIVWIIIILTSYILPRINYIFLGKM